MSAYLDPGTYISEIFKARAALAHSIGFAAVIVGEGNKTKVISNETVIRGKIYGETLTVAGAPPHTATLSDDSDENQDNATLYRDGAALPLDAWSFSAINQITVATLYYDSGATYTIDYVSVEAYEDDLEETPVSVTRIGLFANSKNYEEGRDYDVTGGGNIDWDILVEATFTGLNLENYDLSTDDTIKISLNGKPSIEIPITGSVQTAVTAAEVAADINAALLADANYGSDYNTVASDASGYVKLTAPTVEPYTGTNSSIVLYAASANDALNLIFGLAIASAPYEYRGTGSRPTFGQTYYVTYNITRPDADYNVVREFLTDTDFYADIGLLDANVPLTIAGQIAWAEPIEKLYVVQVKDGDDDDVYTDADYILALDALIDQRAVTDITCLRSTEAIRAKIYQIMQDENSLSKSNFKAAWIGVPRDTLPGNSSTPGTIIYIAKRELRPTGDDVARGRFVVTAPPNWSMTFVDGNGVTQDVELDSSYASVMLAARQTAFERASDTLFRKRWSQMSVESNYEDPVRRNLSANGVNVMVQEGGSAVGFDVLTTDASGDYRYEEPSVRAQKDNLAFSIIEAVNTQLIGLVPDSPIDFVAGIKTVVGGVILSKIENGDIGYYTDSDGETVRDIDYTQDIVAFRDSLDARTYRFKYYFNTKVPGKRAFGEFTVDIPFTVGT